MPDLLEAGAFVFSVAGILAGVYGKVWTWPLTIVGAVGYGMVFYQSRLYGQAALQGFFIAIAFGGWFRWTQTALDGEEEVAPFQAYHWPEAGVLVLMLTMALGSVLFKMQAQMPWFDAFTTSLSLLAQTMLAARYRENWLVWMLVNSLSALMFMILGLWLTAALYLILLLLAILGWYEWGRRIERNRWVR